MLAWQEEDDDEGEILEVGPSSRTRQKSGGPLVVYSAAAAASRTRAVAREFIPRPRARGNVGEKIPLVPPAPPPPRPRPPLAEEGFDEKSHAASFQTGDIIYGTPQGPSPAGCSSRRVLGRLLMMAANDGCKGC